MPKDPLPKEEIMPRQQGLLLEKTLPVLEERKLMGEALTLLVATDPLPDDLPQKPDPRRPPRWMARSPPSSAVTPPSVADLESFVAEPSAFDAGTVAVSSAFETEAEGGEGRVVAAEARRDCPRLASPPRHLPEALPIGELQKKERASKLEKDASKRKCHEVHADFVVIFKIQFVEPKFVSPLQIENGSLVG